MGVGQRACDATQRGAFPLRAALGPSSNTSLTYAPPRQEVNRPAGQTGKFTGKLMVSCIYNIAEAAVEPPALHYTPARLLKQQCFTALRGRLLSLPSFCLGPTQALRLRQLSPSAARTPPTCFQLACTEGFALTWLARSSCCKVVTQHGLETPHDAPT